MKSETPKSQSPAGDLSLAGVVDRLCAVDCSLRRQWDIPQAFRLLPSRAELIQAMEEMHSVLFPGYHGASEITEENVRFYVGATLDRVRRVMQEQIRRGLCFACLEYVGISGQKVHNEIVFRVSYFRENVET